LKIPPTPVPATAAVPKRVTTETTAPRTTPRRTSALSSMPSHRLPPPDRPLRLGAHHGRRSNWTTVAVCVPPAPATDAERTQLGAGDDDTRSARAGAEGATAAVARPSTGLAFLGAEWRSERRCPGGAVTSGANLHTQRRGVQGASFPAVEAPARRG
jgi:hypothetical protein